MSSTRSTDSPAWRCSGHADDPGGRARLLPGRLTFSNPTRERGRTSIDLRPRPRFGLLWASAAHAGRVCSDRSSVFRRRTAPTASTIIQPLVALETGTDARAHECIIRAGRHCGKSSRDRLCETDSTAGAVVSLLRFPDCDLHHWTSTCRIQTSRKSPIPRSTTTPSHQLMRVPLLITEPRWRTRTTPRR